MDKMINEQHTPHAAERRNDSFKASEKNGESGPQQNINNQQDVIYIEDENKGIIYGHGKNVLPQDHDNELEECENAVRGLSDFQSNIEQFDTITDDLYDGNIAEIYLQNFSESVKSNKLKSAESDTSLSEMSEIHSVPGESDSNQSGIDNVNGAPETEGHTKNSNPRDESKHGINHNDVKIKMEKTHETQITDRTHLSTNVSKKRPLSPKSVKENSVELKRLKSEPAEYNNEERLDGASANGNKVNSADADFNPPIAIVAPLGFEEDIFLESSPVKVNFSEVSALKSDISSLLESLDDGDDNSLEFIDSTFDKLKTEISAYQTFKTMDGNNWTFDGKPAYGKNEFGSKLTEGCDNKRNDSITKPSLHRAKSVENEIEDFEKVLFSVMEKGKVFPTASEKAGILNGKIPYHIAKRNYHTNQCQQKDGKPCSHVENSELLRELLDQKTETSQSKARHEIDLSFLKPDVLSGKGLSVSSDKILQTKTIDPRLTSVPQVEHPAQKYVNPVDSQANQLGAFENRPIGTSDAMKLLEGDHISIAEQRKASVTLHHKVSTGSTLDTEASSIIKEAFDFATELSEEKMEANKGFEYNSLSVDTKSVSDNMGYVQNRFMNNNQFMTSGVDQSLKIDPLQNPMSRNSPLSSSTEYGIGHSNNGLLTIAGHSNSMMYGRNQPPQLSGPFTHPEGQMSRSHGMQTHHQQLTESHADHTGATIRKGYHDTQFQTSPEFLEHQTMEQMSRSQSSPFGDTSQFQNGSERQMQQYFNQNMTSHNANVMRPNYPGMFQRSPSQMMPMRPNTGYPGNGMIPGTDRFMPENNLQMGVQERLRAMNVQQWYRKRMLAQRAQMMRNNFPQNNPMQYAGQSSFPNGQAFGQRFMGPETCPTSEHSSQYGQLNHLGRQMPGQGHPQGHVQTPMPFSDERMRQMRYQQLKQQNGFPGTPQGIPNTPHGIPNSSQGFPYTPHGIPNTSHGIPNTTHGIPNTSHGIPNTTHGIPNTSHGIPNTTHGIPNTSHGIPNTTHGIPNTSHGIANIPHGIPNTPHVMTNKPHGIPHDHSGIPNNQAVVSNAESVHFQSRSQAHLPTNFLPDAHNTSGGNTSFEMENNTSKIKQEHANALSPDMFPFEF